MITEDIIARISELKAEAGKDIWLVGGGELTAILLDANLIDEMKLCITLVILGQGIRLFPNKPKEFQWVLVDSKPYDTGTGKKSLLNKSFGMSIKLRFFKVIHKRKTTRFFL